MFSNTWPSVRVGLHMFWAWVTFLASLARFRIETPRFISGQSLEGGLDAIETPCWGMRVSAESNLVRVGTCRGGLSRVKVTGSPTALVPGDSDHSAMAPQPAARGDLHKMSWFGAAGVGREGAGRLMVKAGNCRCRRG